MKGVKRFGVKGKLVPRYIGPFPTLEKCGTVAYKHDLSPSLAGIHDIFHVSQLKKCLKAPVDIVLPEEIMLEDDLSTPSTQSRSWIRRIVSRGVKQSSSSRYNRATTLKRKQLGKVRIFFVLAMQTLRYHRQGTCDCSLFLFAPFLLLNLGTRFCFRGEGCDTSCL
jgi:hypothetical protein